MRDSTKLHIVVSVIAFLSVLLAIVAGFGIGAVVAGAWGTRFDEAWKIGGLTVATLTLVVSVPVVFYVVSND